jgi:hypothetical protein
MKDARRKPVMTLPTAVQFYGDIHLLVYRPRGLIDEAAVNKIISVIESKSGTTTKDEEE